MACSRDIHKIIISRNCSATRPEAARASCAAMGVADQGWAFYFGVMKTEYPWSVSAAAARSASGLDSNLPTRTRQ